MSSSISPVPGTAGRPASWGPVQRIGRAVVAAWLALIAYLAVLLVAASAQGLGATYPFRAIVAIFAGRRVLPGEGRLGDGFHGGDAVRLVVWLLFLAALVAIAFATIRPRRVEMRQRNLLLLAVGWSVVFWLIGIVPFTVHPTPNLQKISSYQGVRELGAWIFLLAHVVFGLVLGWLYRALPVALRQSWRPRALVTPRGSRNGA